jgi:hypothetical protein
VLAKSRPEREHKHGIDFRCIRGGVQQQRFASGALRRLKVFYLLLLVCARGAGVELELGLPVYFRASLANLHGTPIEWQYLHLATLMAA